MKSKTKNIILIKAEIKLMNILWDIKQATVNELIRSLPEPKTGIYGSTSSYAGVDKKTSGDF